MSTRSKEDVVQEFRTHSIQEAAMRVISRKGMSAATMNEIAREAGVAKGTIYLYFRDRDELVERTFETAIAELHLRVDAALERDAPFPEKLRDLIRSQLDFFGEHAEFFRLYMSLRMPEGTARTQRRLKKNCHPQYATRIAKLAELLEAAMERGEIRKVDPRRLALFLAEGVTAITFERLSESDPPPSDDDVEFIAGFALNGIAPATQKRGSQ